MMGFPGECDRCGGSQVWTVHRDEIWVACKHDCIDQQIDLFGRNPPMIALYEREDPKKDRSGTNQTGEGKTL